MGTLTEADLTAIDLWTACPLTFHVGHGEFRTIPCYTPCRKPPYTQKMRDELDGVARRHHEPLEPGDFWVFVDLEGLRRTIRRACLLRRKEYDDERERDRAALAMLRAKSGRSLGEGGADCNGGVPVVAAPDAGGERTGADG
jgi:hypothetical protein